MYTCHLSNKTIPKPVLPALLSYRSQKWATNRPETARRGHPLWSCGVEWFRTIIPLQWGRLWISITKPFYLKYDKNLQGLSISNWVVNQFHNELQKKCLNHKEIKFEVIALMYMTFFKIWYYIPWDTSLYNHNLQFFPQNLAKMIFWRDTLWVGCVMVLERSGMVLTLVTAMMTDLMTLNLFLGGIPCKIDTWWFWDGSYLGNGHDDRLDDMTLIFWGGHLVS